MHILPSGAPCPAAATVVHTFVVMFCTARYGMAYSRNSSSTTPWPAHYQEVLTHAVDGLLAAASRI